MATTNDNIVTAVGADGFFMQTPTSRSDNDVDTSDGIFVVHTGSPTVAVGDQVDVVGKVLDGEGESTERSTWYFTRIDATVTNGSVTVDASNQPLPAPVEFDASRPSPNPASRSCTWEYECHEGLRVRIASGTVASQNLLDLREGADATKLGKLSRFIREVLGSPDIVAVQEVYGQTALTNLASRITADDSGVTYTAHVEAPGSSDQSVGFLVRSGVTVNSVTEHGRNETFIDPRDDSVDRLNDRPPLVLDATVGGLDFSVVVIHNRSLSDIDDAARGGWVRTKRLEQAQSVARLVESLQDSGVIVVGDYNAFEFTDGHVDVVGRISGKVEPGMNLLSGPDLVTRDLCVLTDLSIDIESEVVSESVVRFGVSVENGGPDAARDVVVGSLFAGGTRLVEVTTSGCREDPGGVPDCFLGSIAAGGSASFTIDVDTGGAAEAFLRYTGTAASGTPDPRPADNERVVRQPLGTPNAPSGLTATAIGSMEIELRWRDNSRVETEFAIYFQGPGDPRLRLLGSVPADTTSTVVDDLVPDVTYGFAVEARNGPLRSGRTPKATATTWLSDATRCNEDDVLCLRNFEVEVEWATPAGATGRGVAGKLTARSGDFWFFDPGNIELVVKVLDGCSIKRSLLGVCHRSDGCGGDDDGSRARKRPREELDEPPGHAVRADQGNAGVRHLRCGVRCGRRGPGEAQRRPGGPGRRASRVEPDRRRSGCCSQQRLRG